MLFGEGEQPPFPILSRYPFLFSALLRWVVVFGTAFRVAYSSLRWGLGYAKVWVVPVLIYLVYSLVITAILFRKPGLHANRRLFLFQFCMDTLFCTLFFYLSGNSDSDLYLNYLLPLVLVLEQALSLIPSLVLFTVVGAAYLIAAALMFRNCTWGCSFLHFFVRGYLPRMVIAAIVFLFGVMRGLRAK